jgi:hypothetical protein
MSRKKLTLSVEKRLTERAKEIAERRGTSVSRLVETFFTALEKEVGETGTEKSVEEQAHERDGEEEFSDWARQWRGAFAEEGETYPDDPSWEKDVIAEQIDEKHAS